jgi:Fur family ferric uptake transcriptional regulator
MGATSHVHFDQHRLAAALSGAGERLTAPRRAVAELIGKRSDHFTAAELLDNAEAGGRRLGRATIFRTLELFSELGLLERLDLPSGEHAYVACDAVHHHHVVCSRCARTTEVEDCGLQSVATEMERRTGFSIDSHRLELYGLCPDCRRSMSAA